MRTSDYLQNWLDIYVIPFRAPSTAACYRRAFAALPAAILDSDLQALDGMAIQRAINAKAVQHPRAAQLMVAALSVALAKAVRLHYIPYSPMDGVDKPGHRPKVADVLTLEQLRAYLAQARSSQMWPLLLLLVTCGLRRGEALGLTWAAIDGDLLHIRQQRQRLPGQGLQARPLKSRASHREIPLPAAVVAELVAWPHRSLAGWIVDTTPEALDREHKRILAAAGLPHCTLHGLRHSMATAVAGAGTSIKQLQGLLGHSHYALTADLYSAHLTARHYRKAIERYSAGIL